jgi:NADH-quinone oxidoreductase subunit M
VKLPLVPLHSWQPATYAAIPASGGIILSGVMAKVGAYGMLRFVLPLFPDAARTLAPWAMGLAVVSILYGALAAFAQTDLRRFIAYSSISHLGFVVLGIFSMNGLGQRGAVVLMVAHGCSVAGLFALAGVMERDGGGRDMRRLGGLWADSPRLGAFAMILMMATLGLPGLANFVGEFLVLLGAFRADPFTAVLAACGTVLSAAYALKFMRHVFFGGRAGDTGPVAELSGRHALAALIVALSLLGLGLFPGPLLRVVDSGLQRVGSHAPAFQPRRQGVVFKADPGTIQGNASDNGASNDGGAK